MAIVGGTIRDRDKFIGHDAVVGPELATATRVHCRSRRSANCCLRQGARGPGDAVGGRR